MNILDKIVAVKREDVAHLRPQAATLEQAATARKDFRDFAAALRARVGLRDDRFPTVATTERGPPNNLRSSPRSRRRRHRQA